MEQKEKKSLNHYMRIIHRDIGFFIVGLVIIYSLSGIVLIYRDTDFLKHELKIEKKLSPGIAAADLGNALKLRDLKILKTEGELILFTNGSYNMSSGLAEYTTKELVFPLNKLTGLHKSASKNPVHWFNLLFGILMLLMAISSLWMFKRSSKLFKRALVVSGGGIIVTLLLLFL